MSNELLNISTKMEIQSSNDPVSIPITNVKVSIGDFPDLTSGNPRSVSPIIVYINENKSLIRTMPFDNETDEYLKTVDFARNSYDNFNNKIMFQIFPIGQVFQKDKISFFTQLMGLSVKEIADYPSLSVTPNGNFITSPIIVDKKYSHNGIYGGNQDLESLEKVSKNADDDTSIKINWQAEKGQFWILKKEDVKEFDPTMLQPELMKKTKHNFGYKEWGLYDGDVETNPDYSFVSHSNSLFSSQFTKEKQPDDTQTVITKRKYKLSSDIYSSLHLNQLIIDDASTAYNFPFFFMIQFNQNCNGDALLQFGYNELAISPSGVSLTVGTEPLRDENDQLISNTKKRTQKCDLSYSNQNKPYMPYFSDLFQFKNAIKMIVYPVYSGIAVQAGVESGVTLTNNKTLYVPNGSVAELPTPNKKWYPTIETWLKTQKNIFKNNTIVDSSGNITSVDFQKQSPNIFLQPHMCNWGNQLSLILNNSIANFYYCPVLFIKKARFRMYFNGIKHGKYKYNNICSPKDDNDCVSLKDKTSECKTGTEKIIQYSHEIKSTTSILGTSQQTYSQAMLHTYYGSVLFTTQQTNKITEWKNCWDDDYIQASGDSIYYISSPITAFRIPPPLENEKTADEWDEYNMDAYYFDFEIDLFKTEANSEETLLKVNQINFTGSPYEIIGVIVMQVTRQKETLLKNRNGNGNFKVGVDTLYQDSIINSKSIKCYNNDDGYNLDWSSYIQSIQVSHNEQGSTGSITLDKYALMGQEALVAQSIGSFRIEIDGGNPLIINRQDNPINYYTESQIVSLPGQVIDTTFPTSLKTRDASNILFTGYGTKLSTASSSSSDTITIGLQGVQRKLHDLKLIIPPFWDGDKLEDVLQWLQYYTNVELNCNQEYFSKKYVFDNLVLDKDKSYIDQNGVKKHFHKADFPVLPTAVNFKKPAVNFKSGKDCFSAIQQLCQLCNHRAVVQPDGVIYIYTQNDYAMPLICGIKDGRYGYLARGFDENLIMSFSVEPLLNNLHNFVLSAAFRGEKQQKQQDYIAGIQTIKKFQNIETTPSIPWSKVIAFKHQGMMTQGLLEKQFKKDSQMVKNYWLNVNVTVPGNTNIFLYDRITMFGVEYYVSEISHNVDLIGKKFTTSLTLNNCIKINNITSRIDVRPIW